MDGFRINPHHHTGQRLPRQHTSYVALLLLLMWLGVVLAGITTEVTAESYNVHAAVTGPKPTTAAQILSPANGFRTTVIPISVSGSCQKGLLVNIYKNEVLAGAVICGSGNSFTLPIDLFIGRNDLIARVFSATNQAGPDSATVTVYYDPPGIPSNLLAGGSVVGRHGNVIIKSDSVYRGSYTGDVTNWSLEVIGGIAPYAISVDWGDGQTDLVSRTGPGKFDIKHTYSQPGNGYRSSFVVGIKAVDAEGSSGTLQLATIISDKALASLPTLPGGSRLALAWPLLVLAVLVVISYWLGERHEKKILHRKELMT